MQRGSASTSTTGAISTTCRRTGGRPRAPPLRPSRIGRRRAHAGPRAAGREIGGGV